MSKCFSAIATHPMGLDFICRMEMRGSGNVATDYFFVPDEDFLQGYERGKRIGQQLIKGLRDKTIHESFLELVIEDALRARRKGQKRQNQGHDEPDKVAAAFGLMETLGKALAEPLQPQQAQDPQQPQDSDQHQGLQAAQALQETQAAQSTTGVSA